ncbi:MAG: hypothetical protein MUF48_05410 [Pirellulaceae bacterium]|nr:hypothetical protein [Pirellulaceae bacterium]
MAGLFLAVTVAGQPMHLWLVACGDVDHERSPRCAGRCAHVAVAPEACEPGVPTWSRRHAAHDADSCAICQFFATGKAHVPGSDAGPRPSPNCLVGVAEASPCLPPMAAVYEARGPPGA